MGQNVWLYMLLCWLYGDIYLGLLILMWCRELIKCYFSFVIDIKDIGEMDIILGLKLLRYEHCYVLTPTYYVEPSVEAF